MIGARFHRHISTFMLSTAAASSLVIGGTAPRPALAAQQGRIHFDGTPGTSAPPPTLGPFTMTPAEPDTRPLFEEVTDVPLPNGTMTFSPAVQHARVGEGWATWSHGYTGDVYIVQGERLTMTLPPNTGAFYFYAEPNNFDTFTMEATAQDGTTSGPVPVTGDSGARYFGFFATGGETIRTIRVTAPPEAEGFAVGTFGVASTSPPPRTRTTIQKQRAIAVQRNRNHVNLRLHNGWRTRHIDRSVH